MSTTSALALICFVYLFVGAVLSIGSFLLHLRRPFYFQPEYVRRRRYWVVLINTMAWPLALRYVWIFEVKIFFNKTMRKIVGQRNASMRAPSSNQTDLPPVYNDAKYRAFAERHNSKIEEEFKRVAFKILWVDDEPAVLESARMILELKGLPIKFAINGKQALEILAKEKIDLMITGIHMPIMDGVELLKQIKDIYPNMKKIVVSAYSNDELRRGVLALGAMEYLRKPFLMEEIYELIERAKKPTKDSVEPSS